MKKNGFLKRMLACVLCMLMLVSACAFAEELVAELTEEQQAALDKLPEGFSRSVVAAEMAKSQGCKHTSFYVWDVLDYDSFVYTYIDRETHRSTYRLIGRELYCWDCDELLQAIETEMTMTETNYHCWGNDITSAENILKCYYCDETMEVNWPCEHKTLYVAEDGFGDAYCGECGAFVALHGSRFTCSHKDRTVYYPDKTYAEYFQWNDKQHMKETFRCVYEDLSQGIAGVCNECGSNLVCSQNGGIEYTVDSDEAIVWEWVSETTGFENHTFVRGICACGLEEDNGEMNPTHYSIEKEDAVVTLIPDRNIVELENPMLIVNWAYTLQDGTAFSYTRLIKADDLEKLTYDLGLAEAPAGSRLESLTVIITDEQTLDITVAAKGYGYAQF